jgi:hypothetical protein
MAKPLDTLINWAAAILEEGDNGSTITLAELREEIERDQQPVEAYTALQRLLKAIEHAAVRGDILEEIEKGR